MRIGRSPYGDPALERLGIGLNPTALSRHYIQGLYLGEERKIQKAVFFTIPAVLDKFRLKRLAGGVFGIAVTGPKPLSVPFYIQVEAPGRYGPHVPAVGSLFPPDHAHAYALGIGGEGDGHSCAMPGLALLGVSHALPLIQPVPRMDGFCEFSNDGKAQRVCIIMLRKCWQSKAA